MPNIKSAKKRALTAERNRVYNRNWKSRIRTVQSRIESTIKASDAAAAESQLPAFYRVVDKAVVKGVLHKNTGARKKSRMVSKIQALKSGS